MHTDTHSVYINHIPSIQKTRKKFLTTRLINDVDIINPKAHIFFGGRVLSFFIEPYFRSKGRYRSFENKNALSSMFENQQSILYVSRGLGLIYIHVI